MGSDLYLNVETRSGPSRSEEHWGALFDGPSCALARGTVVDAFGTSDQLGGTAAGYLTHDEWAKMAEHPECPWRLDEPYWVRCIEGVEFVAIVRENECSADLRAFAALVESLLNDGLQVRVWCWNSQ